MDIRLLFVVLNVLAAALPFAGVVIAIRQVAARLRFRLQNPGTRDDVSNLVSAEPIAAELKGLLLSAWLVGGGLVLGAVANIWALYAL